MIKRWKVFCCLSRAAVRPSRDLHSASQTVFGQRTRPQIAPYAVRFNGYRYWWAGGTWQGSFCYQRILMGWIPTCGVKHVEWSVGLEECDINAVLLPFCRASKCIISARTWQHISNAFLSWKYNSQRRSLQSLSPEQQSFPLLFIRLWEKWIIHMGSW